MNRTLVIALVIALGALGLAAPRIAGAAEAAAGALEQAPCRREIEVAARASQPSATRFTCFERKSAAAKVDGATRAPEVLEVRVDAVLPDGRIATLAMTPRGKVVHTSYTHGDLTGSSGKGMALMFWMFAAASVVGALFVVSRRNLIAAVMGMVGSFLGVAAIYMMLYAQFLAVVQVLVYAGAIMVLFVFVVMILNRPEDEPIAPSGRAGQVLGGLAIVYLVGRLIMMLIRVQPANPDVAAAAPPPLPPHCIAWGKDNACLETARHDWGSIGAVGTDLFNAGLFPFEAISVLLLIAVVGAIAIARPLHAEDDDPATKRAEGGVA
jgi:NADH-quinone oxidoreductase subunit J